MSRRTPVPSGLSFGLDFLIDANWSPQQALAVYELLNDLRAHLDTLRRRADRADPPTAMAASGYQRHRRSHGTNLNRL
ncbi:hypothetical protein [Caballeronia grimmiae]|uniref:hypothetical protein n=1 Tax=Caballeronia grimmiae TaxID=1071679 RepID=UPI0038B745FB